MTCRQVIGAEFKVIGSAKLTIAAPGTQNFNFGAPADLYLPSSPNFTGSGDRIMVVGAATTAGVASTLTWVIQDAPDNAGAIGTPAAAITSGVLAGGTGDDFKTFGVLLQVGRPWLRVAVTHAVATDSFVCTALVLAVPLGL